MKRIILAVILPAVLLLCGFAESDYALYVYFEDGDLYMRNNSAGIISDPGVFFHADIRTLDYGYICSTDNIDLEVGETALVMTQAQLRAAAGDLPGIRVHGNSNVFINSDTFTNEVYYYFDDPSAGKNMLPPVLCIIFAAVLLTAVFLLRMKRRKRCRRR